MAIKNLGKQTLIYGLGHIMARLVTFLLLPLYTHTFTQEEYGAISLAYAFMGFAIILYRYGMDTALMKFSIQSKGEEQIKYTSVIIITQLITSTIFSLILYLLRYDIAEFVLGLNRPDWMLSLIIILFLDAFWNLPMLILRSEEKAVTFISFSLVNVILTMALNIYFVIYLNEGVDGVLKANIIASGLVSFLSLPIIFRITKIKFFKKEILLKVLSFSLPFLPAGLFTMIMELSDRYIIEWLLGTAEVGLYSAGKKMGMLGLTAVMGFNMGWTPFFLKRGKNKNAKKQFKIITTIFLGVMGYICLLVSLWISEIMRFSVFGSPLIGVEFWECEPIVSLILLGYFFFGTYVIQLPGVYIKEITGWIPLFRVIGASVLVLSSIITIPIFGIYGAAIAVVIAFFSMSLSIFLKVQTVYSIPYNWKGIIFPILILLLAQIRFDVVLYKLLVSFIFPFVWVFLATDKQEREIFKNQFSFFFKK
jgi:O-antigen/teichoic acid export membrane protein